MCNSTTKFSVGDAVRVKSIGDCRDIGPSEGTGDINTVDKWLACGKSYEVAKVCRSGNIKLQTDMGRVLEGTFNPAWLEKKSGEGLYSSPCKPSYDDYDEDESEEDYYAPTKTTNAPKGKSNTPMSKLLTFVKNLTLSADEKLLRKYDLKTECGDYTSVAREIVISKIVADNEAYLIEKAQAFEADKKASKKDEDSE